MEAHKLLTIYLNDHLFLAATARRLAGRAAGSNRGGDLESLLRRLEEEAGEEEAALEALMGRLGIRPSRVKLAAAAAGEMIGRLKLNGQLSGYSPLSRVLELEGLSMLFEGQRQLWDTLASLPELNLEVDPAARAAASAGRRDLLDDQRREAGRVAMGPPEG